MDPSNEIERGRLFKAIETSYRALEPFRNLNRSLIEEYTGSSYGTPKKQKHEIIINLLHQTVDAYTMALTANRPRVMLSSQFEQLNYFTKHFQLAINNFIEEIGLEFTLRRWVLDAFFCVGIIKIHLADSGFVLVENDRWADPGQPFASNVSLDNWVHDVGAPDWDAITYAADSYRIPFEDLKNDMYDQAVVETLNPTGKGSVGDERTEQLTRGEVVENDELMPMIDLCDVWIPRDNKIYTFAMDRRESFTLKGMPLATMEWFGDERGPYHLLGFGDVPENIMPISPASQLSSLSRLANNLIRKQAQQAKRQKDVHTYTPSGAGDAKRLQRSNDGEWIEVQDTKEIGTVKMGGVDPGNHAFMLGVVEMHDRMAGNLTAMLGLGAQADTATQEQLIHGSVNKKEGQMQYRVVDSSVRVIRSLAYLLWNDPFKVIAGKLPIEGVPGYSVDANWSPGDREGGFEDFKIDIDMYSMMYQSPQQKVGAIQQLISQFYAPLMATLQEQGGQLNMQKATEVFAEMLNLPQLKQLIQFVSMPPMQGPVGSEQSGGMPSSTTRNYVRRSVSSGEKPGQKQQAWLSQASGNQKNQQTE